MSCQFVITTLRSQARVYGESAKNKRMPETELTVLQDCGPLIPFCRTSNGQLMAQNQHNSVTPRTQTWNRLGFRRALHLLAVCLYLTSLQLADGKNSTCIAACGEGTGLSSEESA